MKVLDRLPLLLLLVAVPASAQQASSSVIMPDAMVATTNECKVQPSLFTIEKTLSRGNVLHFSSSLSDSEKVCIKNALKRQKIIAQE